MRNAAYEQVLNKEGVKWRYLERLDLEAVDTNAGLRNQARILLPNDPELQEQYFLMYKEGSDSPPLVVYKKKNRNQWVPIDGNQRLAAARKAGKECLDAYEVQTEDILVLDRLTWTWNNKVNGKRLTSEECLEHAKTMHLKYGLDMKAVAKEWGLPHWQLKRAVTAHKLREVLNERHCPEAKNLSDDRLEELAPFQQLGDDVFVAVAGTVHRCGLSALDVKELKKEVGRAKTHADKVRAVHEFGESDLAQQRKAETKGGTVRPRQGGVLPSERLLLKLKDAQHLLEQYPAEALRRKGPNYKEMREVVVEVVDKLTLVFGLGARPNRETKEVG